MELKYRCIDLKGLAEGIGGVPQAPGVYSIHWFKECEYVPIHRLLGVDVKGILYIGSAENLRKRLRCLVNKLRSLYDGRRKAWCKHTFAASLAYTGAFKRIGFSELRVCFKVLGTVEEARFRESLILHEYSKKYGEPPPLNLSLQRRRIGVYSIPGYGSAYCGELDQDLKEMLGL